VIQLSNIPCRSSPRLTLQAQGKDICDTGRVEDRIQYRDPTVVDGAAGDAEDAIHFRTFEWASTVHVVRLVKHTEGCHGPEPRLTSAAEAYLVGDNLARHATAVTVDAAERTGVGALRAALRRAAVDAAVLRIAAARAVLRATLAPVVALAIARVSARLVADLAAWAGPCPALIPTVQEGVHLGASVRVATATAAVAARGVRARQLTVRRTQRPVIPSVKVRVAAWARGEGRWDRERRAPSVQVDAVGARRRADLQRHVVDAALSVTQVESPRVDLHLAPRISSRAAPRQLELVVAPRHRRGRRVVESQLEPGRRARPGAREQQQQQQL
jgi:hypothetical protein